MSTEAIEPTAIYNKLVKGESPLFHYYVDDSGRTVFYYKPDSKDDKDPKPKTREVMDYWVVFKEKRHNVRTNTHIYRLIGKDIFGNKLDISLPYDIIYGPNTKLFAEIAQHFNIKCKHNLKRSDNLQKIITELTPEGAAIDIKEFDQVIWDNDKLIIPSMEPEGYICNINEKLFPYNMPEELDLWTGLEALKYIIKSVGVSQIMPLITLVFISPVVGMLFPDDRYGWALTGETGSLKTGICRLLLQIYGTGFSSKNTMIKLGEDGSTKNAAKAIAATAGCMPILLDNFKPYKQWSTSELASLIHSLMEGSDKARLTKESELRDNRSFYCLPLITGEDYAVDAATSARIMKLNWKKPNLDILDLATPAMREHLPAIGRIWLEWLMSDDGIAAMEQMKREFPKLRGDFIKQYKNIEATNPNRLATNSTIEALGYELMMHHPVLGQYFRQFSEEFKNGFKKRAESVGKATSEGSEVNVIVEMLKEGLATGTLTLGEDNRYGITKIGHMDRNGKYVYIYTDALAKYASKNIESSQKLSKAAIGQQLLNHGLVIPDKDGNPTQPKHIPSTSKTTRVYVFKKETLIDESMTPVVKMDDNGIRLTTKGNLAEA